MAKQSEIVAEITCEFKAAADPEYRESIQRFFKEPIDVYGVRTADARRISNEYFKRVKHLPKREILEICELLHSGLGHDEARKRGQSPGARGRAVQSPFSRSCPAPKYEEHGVAFSWAGKLSAKLEPKDFSILERWLKEYVSNWAACDTFCGGAVGEFLVRFPEFLPRVRGWAKSKNRWLRRASAVAHIIPNRNGIAVDSAYEVAEVLLEDTDDMVQKGCGWMLKELANKRPREVLEFVMARKDRMPRTALRYAIEKMPSAWKKRAMAK